MRCALALSLISVSFFLVSCGSDSSSKTPANDASQAYGQLIVPEAQDATLNRALGKSNSLLQKMVAETCVNVPTGYVPLAEVPVEFLDAAGNVIGNSVTTDACGEFRTAVPTGAVSLRAAGTGYRPITTDVTVFQSDGITPGVASTILETANYRIAALQQVADDRIAFTITDTESNQAVLGLPESAFTVTLDRAERPIKDIGIAANTEGPASSVLVMDASGSMSRNVFTDPDDNKRYNRFQVASIAGHTFLDQKRPIDETSTMIFSTNMFFMNQATIDAELPLINANNETVPYLLSEDGFTTESNKMRFIMDAYNRESDFYSASGDARHPDSPADATIERGYPFAGSTALYQAIGESIVTLNDRGASRPVVIAMTDGANNRGNRSLEEVVAEAIAANIPVFTIGFGPSTQVDELQNIATRTGGSFFSAESLDLAGAYQSIQTGIAFQYVATLAEGGIDQAFTLGVRFNYNGLSEFRDLTLRQ